MRRRVLVRSRRWLAPGEEDVAEEVRHGLVDVRRGGWELLRRAPAAHPAERLPDRESWLVFSGNSFCYVETTRNIVKRREVTGLAVVVDRTVYSGSIGRFGATDFPLLSSA
jgi:hypothetical protein